jgi:HK97 family phage major capsid protein
MTIKEFLNDEKKKKNAKLDELRGKMEDLEKREGEIAKENTEDGKDEKDLKALGDEIDVIGAKKKELEAEKAELELELQQIEAQLEALDKPKDGEEGTPTPVNPERAKFLTMPENRKENKIMTIEERKAEAEKFANSNRTTIKNEEMRAVLVSSGKIATPTGAEGINDTFNRVCSIVDLVKVVNCEGMGSNKVAFETALGTADDVEEGSAIANSDPTYAFVEIKPESIGVLSYLSKEVRKQSPLDYQGKVVDSAEKALRVKVAKTITSKIVASAQLAKPANLAVNAIDASLLRKIALSYGSEESVYGNAYLFLTKEDLIAFGDIRGTNNKQAVFEITPDMDNPNVGTIKDGGLAVRYCLNPNLKPLATATQGDVVMFYGQPENCELDLFSDYEVAVSEDFAFDKNLLTIKGDAEIGAEVVKKDGFVAVTKGA